MRSSRSRIGYRVPDEVAVVGVDNDEPLCELAIPPLTSIDPNPMQIGYEAAQFLDGLETEATVRTRAGEDDTDRTLPIFIGQGT